MWYSTVMVGQDNAYLITFKVRSVCTHTLAPLILPLLEAPAEGFFWKLLEFGRRIPLDIFHGCETRPLEAHFQSREQPKVTRSEIRRVRWSFLRASFAQVARCSSEEAARQVAGRVFAAS